MIPTGAFRKELRQVLPWALALWVLLLLSYVVIFLAEPPEAHVWARETAILGDGTATGFWYAFWALVLAYAGFPREEEDETLVFLNTLPAPRWLLFVSKAGTCAFVLLVAIVIDEGLRWASQLPNGESFGGSTFRLDWALSSAALTASFALSMLGYAYFLTIFRRVGLLVAMAAVVVIVWMVQGDRTLRFLNPLSILDARFFGAELIVPWRPLLGHGSLSILLAGVAGVYWTRPIDALSSPLSKWASGRASKVALAGGVLAVLVAIGEHYAPQFESGGVEFGALAELDSEVAELDTQRYHIRYPAVLEERVRDFARAADDVHDRVGALLDAQPGDRIEVNLTQTSFSHAGSATWNTIRMDLASAYDPRELARTLAHETAHVLALRVTDRRIEDHAGTLRLLNEGLAEYLSLIVVPDAAKLGARGTEARLARHRLGIDATDLMSTPRFEERFGSAAIYPVGLSWVMAIATECGARAPADLLRALGGDAIPKGAEGAALWQTLLQLVDCSLPRVAEKWRATLGAEIPDGARPHPRLTGGVTAIDDETVVVAGEVTGDATGCVPSLTTRPTGWETAADYFAIAGSEATDGAVEFVVDRQLIDDEVLEFQISLICETDGASFTVWEEWQRARLGGGRPDVPASE